MTQSHHTVSRGKAIGTLAVIATPILLLATVTLNATEANASATVLSTAEARADQENSAATVEDWRLQRGNTNIFGSQSGPNAKPAYELSMPEREAILRRQWECGGYYMANPQATREKLPDYCDPEPAQKAVVTPDRVVKSFRALNIPKSVIVTEPGGDQVLQMPMNLIAQAKPVTRATTLLGQQLQIRATPISYRWTVTDLTTGKISGEPIETTNPGQPYAVANDLQVSFTFHYPGPYRITLATTYHGEYALGASNTWTPIPGTVTTTATPTTITAIEYRNYLINDPDEQ